MKEDSTIIEQLKKIIDEYNYYANLDNDDLDRIARRITKEFDVKAKGRDNMLSETRVNEQQIEKYRLENRKITSELAPLLKQQKKIIWEDGY